MLHTLRILAFVLSASLAAQTTEFVCYFNGAAVVPPTASNARGYALVRLIEPANSVDVFAFASANGTSAELRSGSIGTNGPVVFPLVAGPNGTWTGQAVLGASVVATLKSAGCHLQIASSSYPSGEVRGQVAAPRTTRVITFCNYLQVVPSTNSTASTDWYLYLREPDNRLLYTGKSTLANHRVRLMRGSAIQNGTLIANLSNSGPDSIGVTDTLSAADVADIKTGNAYIDHPTTLYPNGEIRGQLRVSAGDLLADADASQVVPPTGSTAKVTVSASLLVDTRVRLDYQGITIGAGQSITIRKAAIGQTGPVVLTITTPGSPAFTRVLSSPEINDLRAGLWYVSWLTNNSTYPDGEVRGQLRTAALPISFGEGAPAASGERAVAAWQGRPVIGLGFRCEVRGTPAAAAPCALLLGAQRLPQPLDLTGIGMGGGCFIYHDLVTSIPTVTAIGSAGIDFTIPFDQALRGGSVFTSWAIAAPASNAIGVVTSGALVFTVQ